MAFGNHNVELDALELWFPSILSSWKDIRLRSICPRIGSLVHVEGDAVEVSTQLIRRYSSSEEKRTGS